MEQNSVSLTVCSATTDDKVGTTKILSCQCCSAIWMQSQGIVCCYANIKWYWIEIQIFLLMEMHLKLWSAKWRSFHPGIWVNWHSACCATDKNNVCMCTHLMGSIEVTSISTLFSMHTYKSCMPYMLTDPTIMIHVIKTDRWYVVVTKTIFSNLIFSPFFLIIKTRISFSILCTYLTNVATA